MNTLRDDLAHESDSSGSKYGLSPKPDAKEVFS